MAERNPRIPHFIESLLFVNRNGKYCGYKQELISENISADRREFLVCAECSGIRRKPRNWGGNTVCAMCVPEHSMSEINRRAEYKVASLNARCPLSGEGCGWEGKLKEIEGHLEECLQDNWEVCQLKMKRCDYCNQEVKANEENRHKGKCQYHPDTEVPCPYKELGCEAIVLRKNMNTHISDNITNHNKLMQDKIKQLNQLRTKNQQLDRTNQQLANGIEEQERVNQQQEIGMSNWKESINNKRIGMCNRKESMKN